MTIELAQDNAIPASPTPATQGITMENFQAPNLVGIIMQALESHITNLVDKRFNERMEEIKMPGWDIDDIKNVMTETFEEMLDDKVDAQLTEKVDDAVDQKVDEFRGEINDIIDEKLSDHQSEYDHDEYDRIMRDVDDAGLDDLEDKIKEVLRSSSFTINL
jgi:hypothetical protein